ncbi:phage tail tape measure protein [Arthrobacter sp. TMN-50]
MALSLGELSGTLGLDSDAFDKGLAKAQGNLSGFGAKGAVIAGAAAVVISTALGVGIAGAMDMEATNDKLQASLGLTEKQSAAAGAAAGALYADNYGESIGEVSGAVEAVMSSISGMRDASDADIQAMTEKMLILSDAMGIDVVRASQVAGQMITTGLAGNGAEAADLLMASLQKVPVALREDVLDATDEYSVFFEQLGIGGEQAMGMLVAASEKGMYGIDKTGDALKEFTVIAADLGNAGAQEALADLGLSGEDMARKIVQGGDTANGAFSEIVTGLQGIEDPAKQYEASLALFGVPLEDLSAKDVPAFLASLTSVESGLGDVSGAVDKAGEDMYSNAQSGFGAFKRQAETALIGVVNAGIMPALTLFAGFLAGTMGPALIQVGEWITGTAMPALSAFGGWFAANQSTIALFAGIIGAVLLPVFIRLAIQSGITAAANVTAWVLMSGGAVRTAAVYVATSYTMIGRFLALGVSAAASAARVAAAWVAMSTAAVISGARTAAVWTATVVASAVTGAASFVIQSARVVGGWVLMGAQSLIQAARMAAAWFIALGPIGWVIGAVVGLVALIIANWDTVSRVTTDVFNTVWGFLKDVWANIVAWVTQAAVNVVTAIRTRFTEAQNTATSIFNAVVGFMQSIPGRIVSALSAMANLAATVGAWVSSVKDGAVDRFLSLVDWVSGVPGRIVSALGNLGGLLLDAGGQIMGGFLQGLQNSWGAVTDFVGGIGQWIADNKGPKRYDQQLLVPAGKWIMGGLNKGLRGEQKQLERTIDGVGSLFGRLDPSIAVSGNGRLGVQTMTGGTAGGYQPQQVKVSGGGLSTEDRKLMREFIAASDKRAVFNLNGRQFMEATRSIRTT